MMITEYVFIGFRFLCFLQEIAPQGVRGGPVESSKNFNERNFLVDLLTQPHRQFMARANRDSTENGRLESILIAKADLRSRTIRSNFQGRFVGFLADMVAAAAPATKSHLRNWPFDKY